MAISTGPARQSGQNQPAPADPGGPRLQPVPEPPQSRRNRGVRWPLLLAGVLIGAGVFTWQSLEPARNENAALAPVPTAVVAMESFAPSIRLSGTVSALDSAAIRAPRLRVRSQLTLTRLAEAGTFVKAGDIVAQFESRELQDRVDDMLSNVVQAEARFNREKAKVLVERETLRQERDTAKAEYEKAAFDLRKTEVLSEIESQVLRNTAAQAEATWRQLEQELALQEEVFRRRMRIEEIDIEDAKLRHERYARDLERMTLRAPVGGLVVLEPMYKGGGQFQQASLGDQVYPGTVFLRVVDLSGLLVQASVNQVDAEAVSVGMPATIRFDAYPELAVEGRVSNVGAIATSGDRGFGPSGSGLYVKTIPVELSFSTDDPRIIPDLSASVDVARAEPEEALVIPRSAVQENDGEAFVRVRSGNSWERRAVELGRQDAIETVVLAGLQPGEEIALRNPERP